MAKQEQDREDLLGEATALVRRIELSLPGDDDAWVIGFRRDGAASVYIGADPVLQFNAANQLRRAYIGGKLVKAERGQLVWLERRRTETESQLVRREFTEPEQAATIMMIRDHLSRLREQIVGGDARVVQEVPKETAVTGDVVRWLDSMPDELTIASRPHAGL